MRDGRMEEWRCGRVKVQMLSRMEGLRLEKMEI